MSDEFEIILDRCLAELVSGRETVESCSRHYPAYGDRLNALLPLAEMVRAAPEPSPMPLDKRRALESRLLRQAGKMRQAARLHATGHPVTGRSAARRPAARPLPLWRRRGVLLAVSLVVCLLLLTSTVSASAASLPGDALYPIKRTAEQVRVALTPETHQAAVHLELARVRLQELNALAQRGEVSTDLLAELDHETDVILQHVKQSPVEQQAALLRQIEVFQNDQAQGLTVVAALARGDQQNGARAALSALEAKREQVKGLLLKANGPADEDASDQEKGPQPTQAQNKEHPPQSGGPQSGGPQSGGSQSGGAPGNGAASRSTLKPEATDRPKVDNKATKKPAPQQTPHATKPPPVKPDKPTTESKANPPGQGNPNPGSPLVHPTKAPKN